MRRRQESAGQLDAVLLREAVGMGHGHAVEPLLDEDAARAQRPVNGRDPYPAVRRQAAGHLEHGVRFAPEVELLPKAAAELGDQVAGPQLTAERCPALGQVGE